VEKKEGNAGEAGGRVDPNVERRQQLEAAERKELEDLAKARNLADAKEMLNYANIKKKLVLTSLGYYVEYCPLRIEDRIKISELTDPSTEIQRDMRNRKMAYLVLSRADDRWTEEVVAELPAIFIDAMLMAYDEAEDSRFLLPILERRSSGLSRILRRRR